MLLIQRTVLLAAICGVWAFCGLPASHGASLTAAPPTAREALALEPTQPDIDYDRPQGAEIDKCQVVAAKDQGFNGWIVADANGHTLRMFLDNNNDRQIDQWSYYRDGIEVFRDVDSNFDGKADQYRWLGTAGIRWGEDRDQDGTVDAWKVISAEEASAEVVAALRDKNLERFTTILISESEIAALGLSEAQAADVRQRAARAAKDFAALAARQKAVPSDGKWIHFGAIRPGVIPQGTGGSTKDVTVYDSVTVVVDKGNDSTSQLAIGTLVQVPGGWRAIDLPEPIEAGQAIETGGIFFRASHRTTAGAANGTVSDFESTIDSELYAKYQEIDEKIQTATGAELARLHADRARLVAQFVETANNENERSTWIRQLADMTSGAYLNEEFPTGLQVLESFITNLEKTKAPEADRAYAEYRLVNSRFNRQLMSAKADQIDAVQKQFTTALIDFSKKYPQAEQAAEAMLQVALQFEFANDDDEAIEWYKRIVAQFATQPVSRKATGAIRRLESEGNTITLTGTTATGQPFRLESLVGKPVLIHYWATWCEPCKEDFAELKKMHDKYASKGLVIVGISLDREPDELNAYLKQNPLPWTQLYEPGELDSPLAEQLGIATLPTMLLIGSDGKVIDRAISAGQLDRAIGEEVE
jgi:thiol-disulfide isomerase/thioredoxin